MALLRTPLPTDCMIWKTMMPANKTGPRMADTQNHLVRTRSTNSRRMIAQTLYTSAPPPRGLGARNRGRRGSLRSYQIDENLVERRTRQLEPREPRAGLHQRLEDLLGIGAGSQLELRLLAKVLELGHQAPVREDLLRVPLTAVERNDDMLAAVRVLHLHQGAVDQLLAARDDAQAVAQLLGVLHDVRGEEHRLSLAPVVAHGVAEHLRVDGIETGEWLVENHELGIMQDRRNELHLLLHPLGKIGNPSQPPIGETQPVQPLERAGAGSAARHAL